MGARQRTTGMADQVIGAEAGRIHRLELGTQPEVIPQCLQDQQATDHHHLKSPVIKARKGERHGVAMLLWIQPRATSALPASPKRGICSKQR